MNLKGIVRMKEGETIKRVVRQYWVVHMPAAAVAAFLIYAPFFFMIPLFSMGSWGKTAFFVSIAVGAVYTVRLFVIWYWNAFVITTRRVIDIDQRGFFDRLVSEATHDNIQDVSYRVKGLLGTIFRYGTVVIQTAGTHTNLELHNIRDPKEVHYLITDTLNLHRVISNGGARNEKVAALLDTASDLSEAEARAFVVALQEAMKRPEHIGWEGRDLKEIFGEPEADMGEGEEEDGAAADS